VSSKQWVEWVYGAGDEPVKEVPKPKAPSAGKTRKPKSKVHTAYDLGLNVGATGGVSPVEPSPSPPED